MKLNKTLTLKYKKEDPEKIEYLKNYYNLNKSETIRKIIRITNKDKIQS
ncbi:MAG: hypothetical protein PHY33_05895 [Methanobacteriaceae archaeon]|nr:hypothetical protein [Methanobacteriaceae archaeon]MDD4594626.1 hypothetical protein [Methanobacteriaceae archaeon]